MTQPQDWCRTLKYQGTTVLLIRGWNDDHNKPHMTTTFQLDHFIPNPDTILGETTVAIMAEDEDAQFDDSDWEHFCDPEMVAKRIDQTVAIVLGHNNALH